VVVAVPSDFFFIHVEQRNGTSLAPTLHGAEAGGRPVPFVVLAHGACSANAMRGHNAAQSLLKRGVLRTGIGPC